MIDYSNPPTRHSFGLLDMGGGADILAKIRGPKGKKGLIRDIGFDNITEAFNGGTLMPRARVGTIADDDAYIDDFSFGAAAINDGSVSLRTLYAPTASALDTILLNTEVAADTTVMVTWLAATGSGLTGQGLAYIDIIWAD